MQTKTERPVTGMSIDELWQGTEKNLREAREFLLALVSRVQDQFRHVDATELLSPMEDVVNAISQMQSALNKWREDADKSKPKAESFDHSKYVQSQLFFERARSLDELLTETTFQFDRFMPETLEDSDV